MAGAAETEERLREVFAAMGGPGFRRLVEDFERFGEDACDIVLRMTVGDAPIEPFGTPKAHPRDVAEDFDEVLGLTALHWPDRFATLAAADPRLYESVSIVWTLGLVDSEGSRDLLRRAVRVRTAGHSFLRWAALTSLERLGDPGLSDELPALVKDRGSLVRSSAVGIAIGYGDSRLIPSLHRLAVAEKTPRGVREDAWDAIEAIAMRENVVDAPVGPQGARLVPVYRPGEPATVLSVPREASGDHVRVEAGQELAVLTSGPVHAPCDGVIVANLLAPKRPAPPILAWIRTG